MMQHYKYNLTELDDMIPGDREIYLGLLRQYIEEEVERQRQRERS